VELTTNLSEVPSQSG